MTEHLVCLRQITLLVLGLVTCFNLVACTPQQAQRGGPAPGGQTNEFGSPRTATSSTADQIDNDQEVLAAQQAQRRKVEVTVAEHVFKLLPDDRKGLPHQRFLLQLDNGTTVLIAHDIKLAPYVQNLQPGDFVRIHGEYIWNERGGVIHWTHHDPGGRHEPGWIDFNGQRYQ